MQNMLEQHKSILFLDIEVGPCFQNICITISWLMMASSRCAALLMGVFLCFCYVFFWQKLNISPYYYYYYWRPEKWVMVPVFFSFAPPNITRESPNEL